MIADFGLARANSYQETFNVCGTVSYLPPEGVLALDIKHLGYVGMPADCWSAGVILFIMLSGSHPFDYGLITDSSSWLSHIEQSRSAGDVRPSQQYLNTEARLKTRIINGNVDFHSQLWSQLPDAKSLVEDLLVYNHTERSTIRTSLRSRWIVSELKELESLYERRITATLSDA